MLLGVGLEFVPAIVDSSATGNNSLWFEYINENTANEDKAFESDQFAPCLCENNCLPEFACHGAKQLYNNERKLVDVNPFSNDLRFLQECNSLCKCSDDCSNRIVQHGVTKQLVVFDTNTPKGLGVRAGEPISQNTFVCEYTGHAKLIPKTNVQNLNNLDTDNSNSYNYILYVNEVFCNEEMTTIIDATHRGNVSRLINHSCNPNLFMVPVRVNNLIPHIALFALRDVQIGEELSYNYSGNLENFHQHLNLSNKPCLCDSINCRKFLPF